MKPAALVLDLDTASSGQSAFAPPGELRTLHDLGSSLADLSPEMLKSALAPHPGGARAEGALGYGTSVVGAETAVAEPLALFAVTATRIVPPLSDAATA